MFNKQVVIIVGAGASFDKYGLPLGGRLEHVPADFTHSLRA
jgi:hypothetical protein